MDIGKIERFCEKKDYGFESFGGSPRLLLIGEVHNNKSHFMDQEKIIEIIRPSAVLHEFYDPTRKIFFPRLDKWENGPTHYKMNRIKELSENLDFELLPGDIPYRDRSNLSDHLNDLFLEAPLDWPKELRGKCWSNFNIDYAHYYSRLIVEPSMGMLLRKALSDHDGDVIGVYDNYHLRSDSQVHSVLNLDFPPLGPKTFLSSDSLEKIDYATISQNCLKTVSG